MIKTTDFPALTEYLNDIFVEVTENRVASDVGMNLYGVTADPYQTFEHQLLHGVAGIQRLTQGSDFPTLNTEEGDSVTWTQYHFGALISITKDMRHFERHNQIETVARSIIDDSYDKLDQSFSDMFLNGWDTSYTDVYGDTISSVGPDGLALFSDSHTNGTSATTYSNLITEGATDNPSLSRAAIVETRAAGRKYTDPNGIHRPIMYDTLIVGPDLEDLARRIINSDYLPGTANNDTNEYVRSLNIQVWDRLGASSAGTDTSAYWFMASSKGIKETMQAKFSQYPVLDAPNEVYANKNWEYTLDYYYSRGIGFAPYVRGSQGTNT